MFDLLTMKPRKGGGVLSVSGRGRLSPVDTMGTVAQEGQITEITQLVDMAKSLTFDTICETPCRLVNGQLI